MAKRLVRDFMLALGIFVVMAVLAYTNVEFAEPITEYVSFVVTTNFSVEPILQKVGFTQKWATWDLGPFFEGWSQATSGR